jgi:uncharacterized protein YuzE
MMVYVSFKEGTPSDTVISVSIDPIINIDYDKDGNIIGVEVIGAQRITSETIPFKGIYDESGQE